MRLRQLCFICCEWLFLGYFLNNQALATVTTTKKTPSNSQLVCTLAIEGYIFAIAFTKKIDSAPISCKKSIVDYHYILWSHTLFHKHSSKAFVNAPWLIRSRMSNRVNRPLKRRNASYQSGRTCPWDPPCRWCRLDSDPSTWNTANTCACVLTLPEQEVSIRGNGSDSRTRHKDWARNCSTLHIFHADFLS